MKIRQIDVRKTYANRDDRLGNDATLNLGVDLIAKLRELYADDWLDNPVVEECGGDPMKDETEYDIVEVPAVHIPEPDENKKLFVVEVPHQLPARVYAAYSDELIRQAQQATDKSGDDFDCTLDGAIEVLGADMSSWRTFDTLDELIEHRAWTEEHSPHQWTAILAGIDKLLATEGKMRLVAYGAPYGEGGELLDNPADWQAAESIAVGTLQRGQHADLIDGSGAVIGRWVCDHKGEFGEVEI